MLVSWLLEIEIDFQPNDDVNETIPAVVLPIVLNGSSMEMAAMVIQSAVAAAAVVDAAAVTAVPAANEFVWSMM